MSAQEVRQESNRGHNALRFGQSAARLLLDGPRQVDTVVALVGPASPRPTRALLRETQPERGP